MISEGLDGLGVSHSPIAFGTLLPGSLTSSHNAATIPYLLSGVFMMWWKPDRVGVKYTPQLVSA
jgi:hypothetical protein